MENTPEAPAVAPAAESDWKEIPLTEGKYLVSRYGEVARVVGGGIKRRLKPFRNNTPYLAVKICGKSGVRTRYVHRLVAEAFLPHSEHQQVNHIDGDKSNNSLSNLEWLSCSENNLHRTRVLGKKDGGLPPRSIAFNNGKKYASIKEAARRLQVSTTTIRRCLDGYTNTVRGLKIIKEEA